MPTPMTRSFDIKVLDNSLAAITYGEANRPSVYEKCVEIKSSDVSPIKTGVKTHRIVDLGPMESKGETTPINFDNAMPGPTKESYYKDFGLAVAFSRNLIRDELYGVMNDVVAGLGRSYRLHRNLKVAQLFENFFATTYYTADDGLALGSASHTSYGGGAVRSNILAVSSDINYASVQDMLVLMMRQIDDRGYASPAYQDGSSIRVMVQPEDFATAKKIFSTVNGLEPITSNNAPNVLANGNWQGLNFEVIVNPYINKTGAGHYWFMFPAENNIWLVDRDPMEASTYVENSNKVVVHDVTARYEIHPKDFPKVYASGN